MHPIRLELETGLDVGTVNAYLFPTPEPVLVDTGIKSEQGYGVIAAALADHHLTIADLRRVIITHPHVDHCGLAARIIRESEATVWIYERGQPWLLDFPGMWQQRTRYYQEHFLTKLGLPAWTEPFILNYLTMMVQLTESVPADRLITFDLDSPLSLGGIDWQVIYTPGHASMMTCFYQPETRQFLSADMLLSKTPTPIVEQPEAGQARLPALPVYLDSLARVEQLDIDWVYPGHGEPFTGHRALIAQQRARIFQRKGECLAHIQAGRHTITAIVDEMYRHYPPQLRFTALWMVVGYLDLLKAEGAIKEEEINGVWHYYLNQ